MDGLLRETFGTSIPAQKYCSLDFFFFLRSRDPTRLLPRPWIIREQRPWRSYIIEMRSDVVSRVLLLAPPLTIFLTSLRLSFSSLDSWPSL